MLSRLRNTLLDSSTWTQHFQPHGGLGTASAREGPERSSSELSTHSPSPMKGYSMPSLTPGSISTSSVRSSFTSLKKERATQHSVFNFIYSNFSQPLICVTGVRGTAPQAHTCSPLFTHLNLEGQSCLLVS